MSNVIVLPKRAIPEREIASECYRFCFTDPNVDVVLTGPRSVTELDENAGGLVDVSLKDERLGEIKKFGDVVHG
ncbi:MAG: hypothetical protein QGH20_10065, partial [Candidatus Latescibacteria bacterium]|jgi:predicted aldo/keto reductase-like oxidoreductase|nr:hypothetical protein [Candidatus Latescibacterota bacterium]